MTEIVLASIARETVPSRSTVAPPSVTSARTMPGTPGERRVDGAHRVDGGHAGDGEVGGAHEA